jgi:hypothetical protein
MTAQKMGQGENHPAPGARSGQGALSLPTKTVEPNALAIIFERFSHVRKHILWEAIEGIPCQLVHVYINILYNIKNTAYC